MIPQYLRPFFWDVNFDNFKPLSYPKYTISRILERGDRQAVAWMSQTFSEEQISEVVRTDRGLSRKSANFWALVYSIPSEEVAALQ
ncbi:MAG TPA: hypothetical protein VGQ81_03535 [Acidobacteriota bacterium]|nr:hypothetical protein [Acidobacteriota bacterium]